MCELPASKLAKFHKQYSSSIAPPNYVSQSLITILVRSLTYHEISLN